MAAALLVKGFVLDSAHNRDHDMYRIEVTPTEPVWTTLSRGTKHRTLGDGIVGKIKRELKMSKKQLQDFVSCSLTKEAYFEHLRDLGVLPPEPDKTLAGSVGT